MQLSTRFGLFSKKTPSQQAAKLKGRAGKVEQKGLIKSEQARQRGLKGFNVLFNEGEKISAQVEGLLKEVERLVDKAQRKYDSAEERLTRSDTSASNIMITSQGRVAGMLQKAEGLLDNFRKAQEEAMASIKARKEEALKRLAQFSSKLNNHSDQEG